MLPEDWATTGATVLHMKDMFTVMHGFVEKRAVVLPPIDRDTLLQ